MPRRVYKVCVVGKRGECHGVRTLARAKTYARIGAQKGRHARTVSRCLPGFRKCRVVRRYEAGGN